MSEPWSLLLEEKMRIHCDRELRCNHSQSPRALDARHVRSDYVIGRDAARDKNFGAFDFFMIIGCQLIAGMSPIFCEDLLTIDQRQSSFTWAKAGI